MTLEGSNIIIAGGSSGIGLATARVFKQSGANVTITSRNLGHGWRALLSCFINA